MKKSIFTLASVLGFTLAASAQQQNGGLFGYSPESDYFGNNTKDGESSGLFLPNSHGLNGDSDGAPLGTGTALLLGFGAAYLVSKRNRKM